MKKSEKPQTRAPADGEPGKYCANPLSGCGKWLSLDSFHANSKAPDGLKRRCKDCMRAYRLRWDDRASVERTKLKQRRKTAGVKDSEARDAVQHYIETGEVLPLIDESLDAVMESFLKQED